MATQPSTTTDAPSPEAHRWRALAVCLVAGFMTLLDVSIVNVALPSVRDGLHMSEAGLQWVLSGYSLAFGLVLVPAGRLGDAIGRRPVFLAGLALFTATSALVSAARGELAGRRPTAPGHGRMDSSSPRSPASSSSSSAARNGPARSACSAPPSASPPPSARCSAAC